jgi:filamentous hemagglutinin family protein
MPSTDKSMLYPSTHPAHVSFLRHLLILGSSLILLDQSLIAQAQIAPNGAGTLVNSQGNQINITGGTQAGANLFHSFGDFNVNSAQVANFLSNPQTQNILSRINGGNPSFINGLLQVTGGNSNLFLMNPAGIVFGQGASLNVPASFTATTANQIGLGNNQNFSATGNNNYAEFIGNPNSFIFNTTQAGSIVNAGNLAVGSGQNISLIAGNTINTGRLSAPGGEIQVLAVPGTDRVRLSQPGQVLSLEIVLPDSNELKAVDLPALLTGSDLPGIVVNPSGQVEVAGTSLPNQQGIAVASGRIDVSSSVGNGGTVQIMGDRVAALNSRINANGATGGGTVRLGGEYLGGINTGIAPTLRFNSQRTLVDRNSLIRANATTTGAGGRVIVWADQSTGYFGRITGRGATGRGGFVEVSGKENLAFDGRVELQGFNGLDGTLLLDPANIVIQAAVGNGDGLLPTILAGDVPDPMTISAGALGAIAPGTAININASNNLDFQTNVNLIANGTAPITFTAPTITASVGTVTLNTVGRNVLLASNSIDAQNLNINTEDDGVRSGNIQATTSTGNLRLGDLRTLNTTVNAGAITLNAAQGTITTNRVFSLSNAGNGGAVNFTSQGNITTDLISSNSTGGNGGAITLNAAQGIITTGNIGSFARNGNGGAINFTSQGNITTGEIVSLSLLANGGSVTFNAPQGSISTNRIDSTSSGGNGGAINFTSQGNIATGEIASSSINGNGGAITLNSAQGNVATGEVLSFTDTGNGGNVVLNALQGSITTSDIFTFTSSTSGDGGAVNATSQGNIVAGNIDTRNDAADGNGGAVNVTSQQNIRTGYIDSSGSGVGNTSGTINITAGNLFRAVSNSTFFCSNVTICSLGLNGANDGAITLRHGGSTTTPFIVGNSATNGTAGRIDAGVGNVINTITSIPVPPDTYTQGIVRIITTAPVVPPVVTPAAASLISPELLTLLRNPAPPATPAPVVVGTPAIPVVESPIPAPIVTPVVVVPPVLTPEIVPTPVLPPAIVPFPTLIPAPNPTSTLPVILEAIDPQDITPEPESPRGNLVFITNPSSTEIASRLELLELGTRARLRLFEPVTPNPLPPSQTSDYQYNLSAIQNNLNQANQTTGLKSALIYVFFVPHSSGIKEQDTLEVIMINSSGEPLRVQLLDVDRRQVLAVANRLQNSSIYLPRPQNLDNPRQDDRNAEFMVINPIGEVETVRLVPLSNSTSLRTRLTTSAGVDDLKDDPRFDLNAAQQVYEWLLAPLELDLQQQGINHLVFVLDQELRNMPPEAIHDGQGLIRERYSIARTE